MAGMSTIIRLTVQPFSVCKVVTNNQSPIDRGATFTHR